MREWIYKHPEVLAVVVIMLVMISVVAVSLIESRRLIEAGPLRAVLDAPMDDAAKVAAIRALLGEKP